MMSDSGEVNNKTQVRRLRNRRGRRLDKKQIKTVCSTFVNGPERGEGGGGAGGGGSGGGGGGVCGGCIRTKKRGKKEIASCPVKKIPKKEPKLDNFHQLKELMLDTSRDEASASSACSIDGEDKDRSVRCHSHGLISVIGRRREMEDAVAVELGVVVTEFGVYDFFAVYDGHGGARVANACRDRMHRLLAEEVEKGRAVGRGKGLEYWEKVMGKCFARMDEEVSGNVEVGEGAALSVKTMGGSTAVVVMVGMEEVVVANCGDSRAVLSRGGVAVPLSRDHKVMGHFFSCQ